MRTCDELHRRGTRELRETIRRRFAGRKLLRNYYERTEEGGRVRVSGKKGLASTAAYTPAFCRAIMRAWEHQTGY